VTDPSWFWPTVRRRLLILVSVSFVLASCRDAPTSTTQGVVVDALSGQPIAGAVVRNRVARVVTNAHGRFSIPNPGGALRATAPAHLDLLRLHAGPEERIQLWPSDPSDAAVDAHLERLEQARALRDDPSDPALSASARAHLLGRPTVADVGSGHADEVGAAQLALSAPPATIRVWRRSIDGASESCAGRIDEIPFEEYVAGVLPHEWIASWHDQSLRAGALTIRTYAWQWVLAGGKYDCADLDDTARSQVYRDDRTERATAAVYDTTGMAITVDGELVSGEYSAENGDPTDFGVADPLCAGFEIRGHRRGMCQWGSQRWALEGRDHGWIAAHYFPGSVIEGGAPSAGDYDARLDGVEAPPSMVAGERAEVTFALSNTGRREWTAEGTRLVVSDTEPCPFFDEVSWVDETTATSPDAYRYAPGASGRFTFVITAPEVTEESVVEDQLHLSHEDFGPFGPEGTLRIRVLPRVGPPPAPPMESDGGMMVPPPSGGGGLSGGCAAAGGRRSPPLGWVLLGLGLVFSRRAWA